MDMIPRIGPNRAIRRLTCMLLIAAGVALDGQDAAAAAFDVRQFRPWSGYAIPNGLWMMADLNGDGRKDVVHAVQSSDYVHTWMSQGNGTFAVGTFRPWQGYAIPNGVWLVADLNADGREDIVHAVQNTDYVHTWISRGDGTFTVGTFRPWQGYAIPNGVWLSADINGDRRGDIVHVVHGSDYVHTWTSRGDGTFTVGTFRPWHGYAMPNGLWMPADLNGDGRADLVHAVAGSDYIHSWISNGNGTFAVGTFRPWVGYAIPNGEWRIGDFNGDNRDDILHVVANSDYVHVWTTGPSGSQFSVGTFRPWAGYAMPNGLWLVSDYDADGKDDVVHAVQNSDYAHTWLSSGNGTFRVGTFSPWQGYAIPNGLWMAGDLSGDGKGDILHAVANTDYVHPWISRLPRPGELYVDGLEITQSVQNMAHQVPLVANKRTVLRVYPSVNAPSSLSVRGTVTLFRLPSGPFVTLNSIGAAAVSPAENGNLRAKREDIAKSLNFELPANLQGSGTLIARVGALTNAATGAPLPCSDCVATGRAFSLQNSAPIRLRVLGLRYTNGTPPATFAPRALDYTLVRSWLTRAYPVGQVAMSTITVNATSTPPFTCDQSNAQAAAVRNADVAGGTDARTHYYAIVYDDTDARSFFMRGCAAGIPGMPSPGTVASGPTGPATWGWDTDGSYGDWYTGHELGHTYGRLHIGSGCGESSDDPNYPYPNGQISGNDGAFVGFDTGDAANGIAMRALPGTAWRDVMSYCANQWLSDYTYRAIRDRLNAENALPGGPEPLVAGPTPGLEIAPSLTAPPQLATGDAIPPKEETTEGSLAIMVAPAFAAPGEIQPDASAPLPLPEPAYAAAPAPEVVYASAEEAQAGPEFDESALESSMQPAASTETGAQPATDQPATGPAIVQTYSVELKSGDFLTVVATANLTEQTAKIESVRRVPQALVPSGVVESPAKLRVLDSSGNPIAEHIVPFKPNSERDPGEDVLGIVDAAIPFPEAAHSVELLLDGKVVDVYTAAAPGAAASVEVTARATSEESPATGAREIELDWSDAGPAPEGLTYDVQASTDGGTVWQTVAIGLTEPHTTIDVGQFGTSGKIDIRVVANAGFSTSVVDTLSIDLAEP